MIAEEQAFQKAILAVAEGEKIQQQVNTIIDQKSGPLKEIASLNETTLKYAAITENMKEFNYLTKEYNDVIASSNLTVKSQELEGLRKTVSEGNQWLSQANTTFKRLQTSGQSVTQGMLADFNKKYYEVINAQTNAQSLTYEVSRIQTAATTQARNNLINRSTLAKQEIEKIAQQEISKNPGYNYASQVSEILNDIPTVDQQQLNRVNQVLSGKTSWGITDVNLLNNKGAALKAALDSAETFDAYTTAVSKISELDQVPAFGGVYWEMSNVKLAAIVKSKKYVHVDDYAYLDAYYDKASHLTLSSADRVEAEKELAQILGKDNPQLNALNEEVSQLQSKLDNINNQKSNINQNMSTLEVELQQLKSTDGDLENKLSNLTADLNTKTNLISQRRNSLSELNNQLNPLKENLSNLETEKSSANIKLEEQLNIISKQTVTNSETDINNQKIKQEELQTKLQEKALKEEIKLEKERARDIKLFLRKEQALLRIEQAARQKQFLKQLQLEKQIEKFRIREVKELEKLEKISLKEKRDDYAGLQARIEKLKDKYRIIRDQKIRERVEALGVKIKGDEDRETLLQKEKDYKIARQKIELSLESFYRSASSLVFQLNKRHVTRHMSIFRCIDQRFETGEIFIKWDEAPDEEWLLLIYIKDNSPDEGIVIEDKSNPEKNSSHEFRSNEIFKASDLMVDSLTQLISRKRSKKD